MLSRRTFVLTAERIQIRRSLKQHIASKLGEKEVPNTYVAVTSQAWASIIRAKSKSMDHANDAYFLSMVDCCRRLRRPLVEGFFGNCIRGCVAKANVGDLCSEAGVGHAAGAIRQVLDREDLLEGLERLPEVMAGIPKERLTTVGSSQRFMPYETDFGWGAPTRVERVSIFMTKLVVLHLHGGRPLMEAFATDFLAPLD